MREAVLSVSDDELAALGIQDLVALCRSAGLRDFEELECQPTGAVIRIEVESRLDEDRLQAMDYVNWWERVTSSDDSQQYILSFTAPNLSETISDHADDLVGTCNPEMTDQGATLSIVGPHDAISGTLDEYRSSGMSPRLRRITSYNGTERPLDRLTDRQQEVIQTAYNMGFYEVPRETSTEDVAATLDIDPSTVAEHLQRAERNLLSRFLDTE
ncbi:helix-turn-helix domain-containing protein [Halegenticoccus soli]|uniref:helix-turn-helix domain-containing protein n=1 Tax=Halegenticoccus soli TaxID=1985678 RepID=UPI000C6D3886|nr:helix-turn-helix domain-containing protein [Halegenticoccus soli]